MGLLDPHGRHGAGDGQAALKRRTAPPRLTKTAWNERFKLLATTLNTLGLGFAGLGLLGPLLGGVNRPGVQYLFCGVMFIGLHLLAQWVLHLLED